MALRPAIMTPNITHYPTWQRRWTPGWMSWRQAGEHRPPGGGPCGAGAGEGPHLLRDAWLLGVSDDALCRSSSWPTA